MPFIGWLIERLTKKKRVAVAPVTDGLTTDPFDSGLDNFRASGQQEKYLVLSEEERARGFIRPVRETYIHAGLRPQMSGCVLIKADLPACGRRTKMSRAIAETYARNPKFYGATWCENCANHFPVAEFTWEGTDKKVGS